MANDLSSEHRFEPVFARYSTPRLTRQPRRRKQLQLRWSHQGRARTSNKRTPLRGHNGTCELQRVGILTRIRERDNGVLLVFDSASLASRCRPALVE